jgi:preprotein translocase subunit SecD
MGNLNYRVVVFLFAFVFGVVFSIPSLTQSDEGKKITLGLDLQGGLHMLLSVKTEVALESKIKSMGTSLKYNLDDDDIVYDTLKIDGDKVVFELLDEDDIKNVDAMLAENFAESKLVKKGMLYELS